MTTAAFKKMATVTVTIKRTPPPVDGKFGKPEPQFEFLALPPDSMDASAILGYGIQNTVSVWTVYTEGNYDFHKSDIVVIDNQEYKIRNIRVFPNYKKSDNTSYEIVIEIPEE